MKFMLLVAHGSRNPTANDEIKRLAERIEHIATPSYDAVVPAFLEFAQPDIATGIDLCVERGASQIRLLPYFLAAGNHVQRDIPEQLEQARKRHPEINIVQTPHIGSAEAMPELLLRLSG